MKTDKKFYEYETKDGRFARVVCTNMKLIRPVIVLILQDDGTEKIERLTRDLKYMVDASEPYIIKRR